MFLDSIAFVWMLENPVLAIISFNRIAKEPRQLQFIYRWGFINGAFVY